MAYNYSNNHEDNFQDESAEIIGYCSICDSDMICPKCAEGDSVAKCEKCNTYFKVEDLTEYEFNSEVHYFCEKDEPENINEINFSDKAVSAE